ncbi:hypothetical protein EDEG_00830 [Edhazardia aedis USNM 41457]|uniref:Rab-GAP TBC domain-containing protein n=1 Tax=Edhazardia aedis (strain USNM 41457) TaxID=1003232 RepID=J9DC56_EDHAE|nr:hypothetical protein EDEG_00830 [Edhazardia aedis USNM 41457]|eukprot:EJW05049.1 hypothetical protein EDEG_00830 [Edhazardia aedis USNM 41457]
MFFDKGGVCVENSCDGNDFLAESIEISSRIETLNPNINLLVKVCQGTNIDLDNVSIQIFKGVVSKYWKKKFVYEFERLDFFDPSTIEKVDEESRKLIENDSARSFIKTNFENRDANKILEKLLLKFTACGNKYVQSLNLIGAILLMFMSSDDVFNLLMAISKTNLKNLINGTMEFKIEQIILRNLFHNFFPEIFRKHNERNIDISFVIMSWFMPFFINKLNFYQSLAVIHYTFQYGKFFLFKFLFQIIKHNYMYLNHCIDSNDMMIYFHNFFKSLKNEKRLFEEILKETLNQGEFTFENYYFVLKEAVFEFIRNQSSK